MSDNSQGSEVNIEFARNALTQKVLYDLAVKKGFYPAGWRLNDGLTGVHSEVSEAYEAYRNGLDNETIVEELSDVVARCMGIAEHLGVNLYEELFKKFVKNHSRDFLHGKAHI